MADAQKQVVQWFPGHMAKTRRKIKESLSLVDGVVELRDARIPLSSTNPELNDLIEGKPKIILLNKCDLADEKATAEWLPASAGMTEEQKKAYLDYCIAATKSRYTASLELMSEDFYRFVYENIKTSPEEENTSSVGNTSSKEN